MVENLDKIEIGDTVRIKGKPRFGKSKVSRVSGTTVTLETPLDQFRMWHEDDLEILTKGEVEPNDRQEEN